MSSRPSPWNPHRPALSRRDFLTRTGLGLGALSLQTLGDPATATGTLDGPASLASLSPLAPKPPHFAPKARRVVHFFLNGGPSQVDTFDPKPALAKYAGQPLPGQYLRTERKTGAAFASPFQFRRHGRSGIEVSELFPRVAESIDDIAVIRSMHADVPNHEPSLMLMNCGDARLPRPSLGSWVTYGLGSENRNLPSFVVIAPQMPYAGNQVWASDFLPGAQQQLASRLDLRIGLDAG